MTRDEFAAHLKDREKASKELRENWAGICGPDEPEASEAMRKMWEATGAESAFSAMASTFRLVK